MSRWNMTWLVVVPLVVLLGLAVGYTAPARKANDPSVELVRLLADVLTEVDQSYVRQLDDTGRRKLVEDMINGGLEKLDPHSVYFNAHDYKQFDRKSEGKFGGIGINVTHERGGPLVVAWPIPGTPAYEAGILAGDRIVKIEDKAVETLTHEECIDLIQGDPGTPVALTLERDGTAQPFDLRVERAVIEIETILGDRRNPADPREWDYVVDPESHVALIRVAEFDKPTAPTLKRVLGQLDAAGVRGIVLDLRGNPGGLLISAVEIADLFLSSGNVVTTRGRKGTEKVYSARNDGTPFESADRKVAVLIDRNSASASEILAAALQDHGRAVVIGERSYGKGSVQEVFTLANPAVGLKLTTQSYWRPSGQNIHRFPDSKEGDPWGVQPSAGYTVEVPDDQRRAWATARRERDATRGKGREVAATSPLSDKVLEKALEYLKR